jgi:hypothetical protein
MQKSIGRLYSWTRSGLHFIYRSAPWVVHFTNGDSGQMIGSIVAVGYRAIKPVVLKSSLKIRAGVKRLSGSREIQNAWTALNQLQNRSVRSLAEVNQ